MKKLWILVVVFAVGFTARATPLDDKIKNFANALKAAAKTDKAPDQMSAERMIAIAAQLGVFADQGAEANMEATVKQLMAAVPPEAVQTAGKALLAELDARRHARVETLTGQVNVIMARVPNILIKAEKPQDLDGILGDLQKVQAPQGGPYGFDPEAQAVVNRVNAAYQFIAQWQDYLSARNSGNIQDAQNILRNLQNNRPPNETALVPRSEILARLVQLTTPPKPAGAATSTPTAAAVDVASILSGIKTLDDMQPAANSLKAIGNQSSELVLLGQMIALYAETKNGLPVSIDVTLFNYNGGNATPEMARIKSMLLMYLLPRFIGSEAMTPNPNETVNDYLNRSIETAETKEDWTTLRRIINAELKIAKVANYPSGTRSFLAGLNQDTTGQYALAVVSYQNAIRDPDDYLPLKVTGDRLTAIKKDHPAEFEEGMKNFLNPPPAPIYINPYMMRPGMPGYPYPNVMPGGVPVPSTAPVAPSTNAAPTNAITTPATLTPAKK